MSHFYDLEKPGTSGVPNRILRDTGTDSFITHKIRSVPGKLGRMGSLHTILRPLLDTTDDFKFEKFRIDEDLATCPRDYDRMVLFLALMRTSPQRLVRGDVAQEGKGPDGATQRRCKALRRLLMLLSHECGDDSTTTDTTHRAFINSNPASMPQGLEFCTFSMPIHNFKYTFCVATRLNIPVTRSTTLAIHMCGENRFSLAFRGFVLRGFANSQDHPKNKITKLGPFNG
jgi:hypothetical protein